MPLIVLDFAPSAETASLKVQGTDNRSAILCPSYQYAYQKKYALSKQNSYR